MSFLTPRTARRPVLAVLIACAAALIALGFGTPRASAAGNLTIYSNKLASPAAVAKVRKYGKGSCSHKGSTKALRVKVGKATRECFYNIPVVGRDLQATIAGRLFKSGSKAIRKRTWVSVNLRQAPDGSRYQLAVLPVTGRYSLRKVYPDGKIKYLANGKERKAIRPVVKANRITLRAYNGVGKLPAGTARLVGIVNGKRLALVDDPAGNELTGRDTTISIGSSKSAKGAFGSFVNARVAMPDPF